MNDCSFRIQIDQFKDNADSACRQLKKALPFVVLSTQCLVGLCWGKSIAPLEVI